MEPSTISQRDIKNIVCEAVGCTANATTQINIPVGDLGTISLLLCNDCKPRFADPLLVDDVNGDGRA